MILETEFDFVKKILSLYNTYVCLALSLKEKGCQCISNRLLMIVGASMCEAGVVYVGSMPHL